MKSWKREWKKVVKNIKQQSILYQINLHELFRLIMPVIYFWVSMKNHDFRSVVPKLFSNALCLLTSSEMSNCGVKLPQKIPRGPSQVQSIEILKSIFSLYRQKWTSKVKKYGVRTLKPNSGICFITIFDKSPKNSKKRPLNGKIIVQGWYSL